VIGVGLVIIGYSNNEEEKGHSHLLVDRWQLLEFVSISGSGQTYPVQPEPGESYGVEFKDVGSLVAIDACNDCASVYEAMGTELVQGSFFISPVYIPGK